VPRVHRVLACAVLVLLAGAPAAGARDPITPLSDVHRGLACTARTVVQGTAISSFDVQVLDVVSGGDGFGPRILVRVSGPVVAETGVAQGFSGSPIFCPDAQGVLGNAGAISEAIGAYGNDVVLATPIEEMLGLDVHPPSGVRRAPRLLRSARPLAVPLAIGGLTPSLARLVERSARHRDRVVLAAPVGPLATFAPQPLVPGASLGVSYASGDVSFGGVGTVTYRDGDVVYGFGHAFEGAGRRSLLLQDAYVYAVIAHPFDGFMMSYKLAVPGHALGTLTSDQPAGVVGTVGAPTPTVPVSVLARDEDRGRDVRLRTDVADETDLGAPGGPGVLPTISSIAVAEGIMSALGGTPADQTAHFCLRVGVRELHKPLRFCNRYVASGFVFPGEPPAAVLGIADDVFSALDVIDSARYDALHVTHVSASARVQRGLRLATIRSVSGPRKVRPGKKLRLRLRVRLLRGPLRTIRVKTRVPRDVPTGPQTLRVVGTGLDGEGFGIDGEEFFFDLFGGGALTAAQSPRQVRSRFARLARWDGVSARVGRTEWRLFRSARLRIDGRGSLDVRIVGKHRRGRGGPPEPTIDELIDELLS
jgi:hypothetical protein